MGVQGYLVRVGPDEWAVNHAPVAATQATISRIAAAGLRHFCRSVSIVISAVAAQAAIVINLRDGATGAGTILKSWTVALPVGGIAVINLSGLNIPGTANTAMTLETVGAPAGTNFASVTMDGYDAP